jgi:hypothetical protein
MLKRRMFIAASLSGLAASVPAFAQLSPPKTATGTVGGKPVSVDYFSPSMRGRKIFGSLIRYGEVWCPGANWATKIISNEAGLEIGSMKLPKGEYAIWVQPTADEWTAIINSDSKAFHLDYKPEKDIGRLKMTLKVLDEPVEQLRFEVRPGTVNQGTIALLWEKTEASIPFTVVP